LLTFNSQSLGKKIQIRRSKKKDLYRAFQGFGINFAINANAGLVFIIESVSSTAQAASEKYYSLQK